MLSLIMVHINKLLIVIVITTALSACAPEPVFRLQAEQESEQQITKHMGMEYLISELENSTAILSYYRHVKDRIIFDLEIFNDFEEMIRFEPEHLSYKAYRLRFEYRDDPQDGELKRRKIAEGVAINPEETILSIDLQSSRVAARDRTNRTLEGIGTGLELVSSLHSAGGETPDERTARETRQTRQALERAERRDRHYQHIANLNEQRAYWETETIRTTDLAPGSSIAGEISIPAMQEARIFTVIITVGEDIHRFTYWQEKHDAK